MKKLTIIALHLNYGGIEKAIASLVNSLCDDYKIKIVVCYKIGIKPAFIINKKVEIEYLINDFPNKKEWIEALKKFKIKTLIRESVKSIKLLYLKRNLMINRIKKDQSDIIISTRPFHNKMIGKYAAKNTLKIGWEHSHHNNNSKYIKKVVDSCKNLDYLIPVSKELTDFYKKRLTKKTKCFHISLSLDEIPKELSNLQSKSLISIGRLSKEKGYEALIDVFKLVNLKHKDWTLNILGDGLEKKNIEQKIKNYKLEENIKLHGFKSKPEVNKLLKKSSIYIMTSISESFGLALLEAMSYGIPCLAFDSAKGPLEIIKDNVNGYIIKKRNKQQMANKICLLIEDEKKRKLFGKNAYQNSKKFSKENIKKDWIKLLESKGVNNEKN